MPGTSLQQHVGTRTGADQHRVVVAQVALERLQVGGVVEGA
jgi:hypothetical protein